MNQSKRYISKQTERKFLTWPGQTDVTNSACFHKHCNSQACTEQSLEAHSCLKGKCKVFLAFADPWKSFEVQFHHNWKPQARYPGVPKGFGELGGIKLSFAVQGFCDKTLGTKPAVSTSICTRDAETLPLECPCAESSVVLSSHPHLVQCWCLLLSTVKFLYSFIPLLTLNELLAALQPQLQQSTRLNFAVFIVFSLSSSPVRIPPTNTVTAGHRGNLSLLTNLTLQKNKAWLQVMG